MNRQESHRNVFETLTALLLTVAFLMIFAGVIMTGKDIEQLKARVKTLELSQERGR